ncbi:hypothetical protein ACFX13_018918 [Malus domestica]
MQVITFSCSSSAKSKFVAIFFSFCSKFVSTMLMFGTMTLEGMITSEPYTRENGVSPVAHLLVVRYTYKTSGSSSGHLPFLSKRDFLRQSRMVLLDTSACSLSCGYRGVDMCCLILYFSKNFTKYCPRNVDHCL